MSDQVQFDNENEPMYRSRSILGKPKVPKMAGFLVKKGLVKDERSAAKLLLTLSIVLICTGIFITMFYVFGYGKPDNSKAVEAAWQNYLSTAPKLPSSE